jgi:hypothetical protein
LVSIWTRVLFDVVARLLAQLDLLGQLGQTLGVERVIGVEMLDRRLVEPGQRHRFELEPVHRQVVRTDLLHLLDEIGALLVELVHRHARRDRTQRVDELALDQILQRFGVHRAQAQRLRRHGNRARIGTHANVEFGLYVDAQPVERDQRVDILAFDRQPHGVHVHGHRFVEHRQHQRAAVHDHPLAAESGADKSYFFRRAPIKPRDDQSQDEQDGQPDTGVDRDFNHHGIYCPQKPVSGPRNRGRHGAILGSVEAG